MKNYKFIKHLADYEICRMFERAMRWIKGEMWENVKKELRLHEGNSLFKVLEYNN